MEIVRPVTGSEVQAGLASWTWLDLSLHEPFLGSLFGDLFFVTAGGGVWMLDALQGRFEARWSSPDEMAEVLTTPRAQEDILLAGLAQEARENGVQAADGQILWFDRPLVLGGELSASNLTTIDSEVGLHLLGQLHESRRVAREAPLG